MSKPRHNSLSIKARVAALKSEREEAIGRAEKTDAIIAEKEALIEQLESDIKDVDIKISLAGDDLDAAEACIKDVTYRAQAAEANADASQRSENMLEKALEKEQDIVKELEKKLSVLNMERDDFQSKYDGAVKDLNRDSLEDRVEELESENERIRTKNNELETKLNEILRKNRMMESEIVKVDELSVVLEGRQKEVEEEIVQLNEEMKEREASEAAGTEREDELEVVFIELREAKASLDIRAENAERQIQVLEETVLRLEEELDVEREEHRLKKENLQELRDELEELDDDIQSDEEAANPGETEQDIGEPGSITEQDIAEDVSDKEKVSSYEEYSSEEIEDE